MRSRDYGTPWPPWLEQNRTWLQGLKLRQISMNPTDLHFFTLEDGFFHPYVWWSPEMNASPSAPRRRRGIPPSWLPSAAAPTPTANPPWPHQRRHQQWLCRRTHLHHRWPALGSLRRRPQGLPGSGAPAGRRAAGHRSVGGARRPRWRPWRRPAPHAGGGEGGGGSPESGGGTPNGRRGQRRGTERRCRAGRSAPAAPTPAALATDVSGACRSAAALGQVARWRLGQEVAAGGSGSG